MNDDTRSNSSKPLFPVRLAWGPDALRIALVAVAYFVAHQVAFLFPDTERLLMAVWPAGGIGLAALLLSPRRRWPPLLAALFLAGNAANLLAGRTVYHSLGFMMANVLESLACAWWITHWCGNKVRFTRVKEVVAFIGAATLVNAGTAFIGAGAAALADGTRFWSSWGTWLVSDGLGILIVAPLIVTWFTLRDFSRRTRWGQVIESGLFMTFWCVVSWLSFQGQALHSAFAPQPYMLVALLAYAALRLDQREVTFALGVLTIIAVTSEAVTRGPLLWGGSTPIDRLQQTQLYLACVAITGFLLAASYAASKSAEQSARDDQARVRTLGDNLPNGMVFQVVRELDGAIRFSYMSAGVERLNGVSAEALLRDASVLYRLIVDADRSKLSDAQKTSAAIMKPLDVMVRLRRPDGQLRCIHLIASPRRLNDGRMMWDGIEMDITERKQAEDQLRSLSRAVEQSPASIVITDTTGTIEYVNPRFTELTGYTLEETIGRNPRILKSGKTQPEEYARLWDTITAGGEWRGELCNRKKNGDLYWEAVSISPIIDEAGLITHFVGVKEDITSRRLAEEALRASENRFRTLIEQSPIAIVVSRDDICLYGNQKWVQIVGLKSAEESVNRAMTDFIAPNHREASLERTRGRVLGLNVPVEYETVCLRADDIEVPVHVAITRVQLADGPANISFIRDITESRRIEEALSQSEERFRTVIESAPLGIAWSRGGLTLYENSRYLQMFGYQEPEEINGHPLSEQIAPQCREEITERARRRARGEFVPNEYETIGLRKDGSQFPMWVCVTTMNFRGGAATVGFFLDISERKQMEMALRRSETDLKRSQAVAHVGHWAWDTRINHVTWSDEMYHIFGLNRETFTGNLDEVINATIHPDDKERVVNSNNAVLTEQRPEAMEYRVIWPDSSVHHLWAQPGDNVFGNDGKIVLLSGIVQDITERKRAEDALRDSERRYRSLYATMSEGAALHQLIYDPAGRPVDYLILDVNPAYESILGLERAKAVGSSASDLYQTTPPPYLDIYASVVQSGQPISFDAYFEPINKTLHISSFSPGQGQFATIFADISERTRMEKSLRESEARYKALFEYSPVSLWEEDGSAVKAYLDDLRAAGVEDLRAYFNEHPQVIRYCASLVKIIRVNQATRDLFQISVPDELSEGLSTILTEASLEVFGEELLALAEGKLSFETEIVQQPLHGPPITCLLMETLVQGYESTWGKVIVSITDITERKQMEAALRASEERFRKTFEHANVGICLTSLDGRLLQVNDALCQMLGYSQDTLEELTVKDITHPEDQKISAESIRLLASDELQQVSFDKRYLHQDGHTVWVEMSSALIRDVQRRPAYFITHIQDITERKQMENAIRETRDALEQRVRERTADLSLANELLTQEIVERERAEAAEKKQRLLAEVLIDTATALNSTLDFEEVLDKILANLGRLVQHPTGDIMFLEADLARVVRSHGYEDYAPDETVQSLRLSVADAPNLLWMMETGQPLIIPDTRYFEGWLTTASYRWIRSYAGVPIRSGQQIIGFINLVSPEPDYFRTLEVKGLRAFADQAAVAIENARLYSQAQAFAALEERHRIAQELHDAVSQTLWSAHLIADVLPGVWERDRAAGERNLQDLRQLTRGALAEMRTLLWELRPAGLTEVSFGDLIQQLTQAFTGRTGILVDLGVQGLCDPPPDIQVALYRLVQEALNNVARHAAASEVTLALVCQPRQIALHIRDNGQGFRPNSIPAGHLGLGIMRERAQAIGAVLTIDSQVGHGTTVDITWTAGL